MLEDYPNEDYLASSWPSTSETFTEGLEDDSFVQKAISKRRGWDDNKDDFAVMASYFKESGECVGPDKQRLTVNGFRTHIDQPLNDAQFKVYFIPSHDKEDICTEHFLYLFSKLNTPVSVVDCWLQRKIGGFGSEVERDSCGKPMATHTWLKYWIPIERSSDDPSMYSESLLRYMKRLQASRWRRGSYAFYLHSNMFSKETTIILLGPSTMHTRVTNTIRLTKNRRIFESLATLSTILTSHCCDLINIYANEMLYLAFSQIETVLTTNDAENLLRTQQSADLHNIYNRQCVSSILHDVDKLKALQSDLSPCLTIDDETSHQISKLIATLEYRGSNLEHKCLSLLESDSRRMNVLLAHSSLRSIQEMRKLSADTLERTSQMHALYSAALKNSEEMRIMTEATQEFTKEARRDTVIMRTIAVVTMVFLPPTALATILSLEWFNSPNRTPWSETRIFYILAAPVTLITLLLSYLWLMYSEKREQNKAMAFGNKRLT